MLLLCGLCATSTQAQERNIEFEKSSWADILAQAEKEDKLIFLDAYASWCGPCKWMAANVFTVNEVADLFNTHFICAKIDMEKGEGVELAKKYQVRAYPTLLFVNAKGEVAHRVVGALNETMLVEQGLKAMNPYENLLAYKKRFEEGEREAAFMKEYLELLSTSGEPTGNVFDAYFAELSDEDRQTEDVFEMINSHVDSKDSDAAAYLMKNRTSYEKIADEKRIATKIANLYMQAMATAAQQKDEAAYSAIRKEALSLKLEGMKGSVLSMDLRKAMFNDDWKAVAKLGDELFEKYESEDAQSMNSLAWNVYESTDNKKALNAALGWAKRSISLDGNANNNDTAAALLYKLGEYKEAKNYSEKAVELAKKEGLDMEGFQDMLTKINTAIKKS